MTLLARILSHGFAIAIVVLLAIGLIYRGKLFPEYQLPDFLDLGKLVDRSEETAPRESAPAVAPSAGTSEESSPQVTEGRTTILHVMEAGEVTTAEADAGGETGLPPQETSGDETPQSVPGDVQEVRPAVEEEPRGDIQESESQATGLVETAEEVDEEAAAVTPAAPSSTETTEPTQSVPPQKEIAASPEEPVVQPDAGLINTPPENETAETPATSKQPQEKPYQLLAEAREAYWLRDYETAEAKYLQLIEREPDNADGYGELGNMYFSQGQWEKAASVYFEAGKRLLAQGLLEQAEEMVEVVRGLNGAHADELQRLITEARNGAE